MPKYYHAFSKKDSFFEIWYFKHIQGDKSIAIIPGIHFDRSGHRFAFIEIATNHSTYYIPYPFSAFNADKNLLDVQIDVNHFSARGIKIFIDTPKLCLKGAIHYGPFKCAPCDQLSPFYTRPFTPYHFAVISMSHPISGYLVFNNETFDFNHGRGYIETNWGHYLPKIYLWTQCNVFDSKEDCSITANIFPIMFLGKPLINAVCSINYQNKVYTIATYLGGKIIEYSPNSLTFKQANYFLSINLINKPAADFTPPPLKGDMTRTIHNCSNCTVSYRLEAGHVTLFDLISHNANFEFFS